MERTTADDSVVRDTNDFGQLLYRLVLLPKTTTGAVKLRLVNVIKPDILILISRNGKN